MKNAIVRVRKETNYARGEEGDKEKRRRSREIKWEDES
jgi:hypothetical protein